MQSVGSLLSESYTYCEFYLEAKTALHRGSPHLTIYIPSSETNTAVGT